jgi:hypothetical protein
VCTLSSTLLLPLDMGTTLMWFLYEMVPFADAALAVCVNSTSN